MLEKPGVNSRGHIFSLIIMKLGHNVCLDDLRQVRKWIMSGQKLGHKVIMSEKTCVCSRGHIFSLIIIKLGQNVCLGKILDKLKNGSCWKTRSLGQMLEKPCVCS